VSNAEAIDAAGGTLMATGLFSWLAYLYAVAQEVCLAYRYRNITTRRCI
jgi:hypothetical protein